MCVCVWTKTLNSILTADVLVKWKLVVVNRFIMCKYNCETIEHLLLHCWIVPLLESCNLLHLMAFGVIWVMASKAIDLLTI